MNIPKSIGIKLYDDTFVPVLTEGEIKNKKITLTTVRDNQKKVIIELYEGSNNNCIHNEYLGKLNLPLDRTSSKGDPAFEVHLRLDEDGILYAKAWDTDTGEESEIKIEHSPAHTITHETMSDRQLDDLEQETGTAEMTEQIVSYDEEDKYLHKDLDSKNKPDLLIKILLILAALLVIVAVIFLVRTCIDGQKGKPVKDGDEITQPKEEVKPEDETPLFTADETDKDVEPTEEEKTNQEKLDKLAEETQKDLERQKQQKEEEERKKLEMEQQEEERRKQQEAEAKRRQEEEEKKKSQDVLGMKKPEGKEHKIKYGDNLWNICKKYYGDPWYYPHLAEINNLKNPRLIYTGRTLIIPPKNSMKRWDFNR